MVQIFAIGLTASTPYRLALRRRQIDLASHDEERQSQAGFRKRKDREGARREAIIRNRSSQEEQRIPARLVGGRRHRLRCRSRIVSLNPAARGFWDSPCPKRKAGASATSCASAGRTIRVSIWTDYVDTGPERQRRPVPENVYVEREGGRRLYLTGVVVPILDEPGARPASS